MERSSWPLGSVSYKRDKGRKCGLMGIIQLVGAVELIKEHVETEEMRTKAGVLQNRYM